MPPRVSLTWRRKISAFFCLIFSMMPMEGAVAFIQSQTVANPTISRLSAASDSEVVVALTRELGKNEKIRKGLQQIETLRPVELPCIAFADGPDFPDLARQLQTNEWDYVACTSPESARVLAMAWNECTFEEAPKVCAVGKATEESLAKAGIPVVFCPSKATAATLVKELPLPGHPTPKVLYPASARAKKTLQNGLTEKGFHVVRLDTYDTVTAVWTEEERTQAKEARIACFASPSSVKGWLANSNDCRSVLAACIGETSAQACREQGWSEDCIFYPDKPGVEGWIKAVKEASDVLHLSCEQR